MKLLIKSNKGSSNILPLRNIIQDEHLCDTVFEEDEKCELLNKYFNFISTLNDENITIPDMEKKTDQIVCNIIVSIDEIIDVIEILDPNKASGQI